MNTYFWCKQHVRYCKETGLFYWLSNENKNLQWNGKYAGKPAGSIQHEKKCKTIRILVNKKEKFIISRRLAWYFINNKMPKKGRFIININGDYTNDKPENLKEITLFQKKHLSNVRSDNLTGYKGVERQVNSYGTVFYKARIGLNSSRFYIGNYRDPKLAAQAYDYEVIKHFGDLAVTNKSLGLL